MPNPIDFITDLDVVTDTAGRGAFMTAWRTPNSDLAISVWTLGMGTTTVHLDTQAQHMLLSCLLVNLGLAQLHEERFESA